MGAFLYLAEAIVKKWSLNIAENQMLYDKTRTLQILVREITLSMQIAKSKTIIKWAYDNDNPDVEAEGLEELEAFKNNFSEGNYFVAFKDSGKYFYNNYKGTYSGIQFRYILNPEMEHDSWFYSIINENKDFHVNVNPDVYLNVTKVWTDVLIRDGDKILGVLGTGIDLDKFIKQYADIPDRGTKSIFIDHKAAVQIYFDKVYIDFASITKSPDNGRLVFAIFDRQEDIDFIKDSMREMKHSSDDTVKSRYVVLNGIKYLAGISYIKELDWYQIVLRDVHGILTLTDFRGIIALFIITLIVGFIIYNYSLKYYVLDKLKNLEFALNKVRNNDFSFIENNKFANDEIGSLMKHFRDMAASVKETQENLEKKVAERTLELENISRTDTLTGLLNRRGIDAVFVHEVERSLRRGYKLGVLLIDIDHFKDVNDCYGHQTGDKVLKAVAECIRSSIRTYDFAARWGGDEFLVLLPEIQLNTISLIGKRVLSSARNILPETDTEEKPFQITLSIGGCIAEPGDTVKNMLYMSDKALYQAKDDGRNCFRIFGYS